MSRKKGFPKDAASAGEVSLSAMRSQIYEAISVLRLTDDGSRQYFGLEEVESGKKVYSELLQSMFEDVMRSNDKMSEEISALSYRARELQASMEAQQKVFDEKLEKGLEEKQRHFDSLNRLICSRHAGELGDLKQEIARSTSEIADLEGFLREVEGRHDSELQSLRGKFQQENEALQEALHKQRESFLKQQEEEGARFDDLEERYRRGLEGRGVEIASMAAQFDAAAKQQSAALAEHESRVAQLGAELRKKDDALGDLQMKLHVQLDVNEALKAEGAHKENALAQQIAENERKIAEISRPQGRALSSEELDKRQQQLQYLRSQAVLLKSEENAIKVMERYNGYEISKSDAVKEFEGIFKRVEQERIGAHKAWHGYHENFLVSVNYPQVREAGKKMEIFKEKCTSRSQEFNDNVGSARVDLADCNRSLMAGIENAKKLISVNLTMGDMFGDMPAILKGGSGSEVEKERLVALKSFLTKMARVGEMIPSQEGRGFASGLSRGGSVSAESSNPFGAPSRPGASRFEGRGREGFNPNP